MERATNEQEQCTHVGQHGRCKYKIHEGAKSKCSHHGGVPEAETSKSQAVSSYRLNLFQSRMQHHLGHSELKNLRSEIAILRMLVENKLNQCQDDYDLMLHSAGISDLVAKINLLVQSCHRLETSSGELMDKQTLAQFADDLITMLGEHVDEAQLEQIAGGLMTLMEAL